jgi:hypothetical protein
VGVKASGGFSDPIASVPLFPVRGSGALFWWLLDNRLVGEMTD